MQKKPKNRHRQRHLSKAGICFEALEPRLLLSGSWGAVVDGPGPDTQADAHGGLILKSVMSHAEVGFSGAGDAQVNLTPGSGRVGLLSRAPALNPMGNPVPVLDASSASIPAAPVTGVSIATPFDDNTDATSNPAPQADTFESAVRRELVLVNDNVAGYDTLINGLRPSDENRIIEVVMLDADRDGIGQVSEILAGRSDLSAVHVITHGNDGSFALGSDWLNTEDLHANSQSISSWADSLNENADILLYGCNISADGDGQLLTNTLAELSGADVASSDDATGRLDLGGDWELEFASGSIETEIAISASGQQEWENVLANVAPTLSGANNLTAIDEDDVTNSGTLVSDLIFGQISDADSGSVEGIAVIAVDDTHGTWEYTTDGGSIWTAFGSVDSSSARLLSTDADTYVRFVPDADWNGTVTDGITFHAWDQTSGTAGGTADLTSTYTVRDEFSTVAYNNDDGTAGWASNWNEVNDDGSASTGGLRVESGVLHLDNQNGGTVPGLTRQLDLSGATAATLTFDYSGYAFSGTDSFSIRVSDDGGSSWVELEAITFIDDPGTNFSGNRSFNLSSYVGLTANMVVRFQIASGFAGPGQHVNFDNVQVEYTTGNGTGGTTAFSAATASSSITVNPANDAPVINSAAAVNAAENQTAVTTVTATDADGDTPTFSITGGDDSALFSITAGGVLTFNSAQDFENFADFDNDGVYEVEVTANDGNTGTDVQTILVTVTDVNETPTLVTLSTSSIDENTDTSGGHTVGALTTTDPDSGDTTTYSINGGADAGLFSISGSDLILTAGTLDFETKASYEVTVRIADSGALTHDQTFTITVNDLNEAPSFDSTAVTSATQDVLYSYTVTTSDVDGDGLTISATTLPAWLSFVDNGDGSATLTGTPTNLEVGDHAVVLEVSDGSLTDTQSFTITVGNTNDAPVITSLAAVNAAENQTSVTTVTATDADGDTPTFSITGGADSTLFSITAGGVLTFNSGQDFETFADADNNGLYEVEVTANDGNTGTDVQTILVTVTDVNEAPTLVTLSTSSIDENTDTSGGTTVGSLNTTDPDSGDTTTYSINGGADAGLFSISGSDLILTAGTLDFETKASYEVTVRIADSGALTHDQTFTITVNDLNEAPSFDSTAVTSATQDVLYSYTVTTSDVDGDGLTISATTLPAWLSFVDNGDGSATLTGTPTNLEVGDHAVVLEVSDGSLTDTQSFTITVGNTNDAPVITSLAAVNAAENQTSVTTVTATDADGDTPTFSITGGADSTLFSITAGGVLTFNSGQDFETFADADNNGLYEVEVTANDGNTGTDVQTILVTVTDVNEAPTLVTLSSSTVDENIDTSSGYTVGWLTTTDPDAGDTTAYTINGGADNALFTIGGAGNDELILTDGILDFETQSSYEVTVRITDSGGLTHDQTFTILVNDLNEAPVITSLAAVNAAENQTSVTTVTATDADGDTPTFSITGGADSTLFSITAGGVLTFNSGQDFETFADADNNGLYEVEVTANDGNTGTDVQTILVTVTDVNEAPTLVTLSSSTVDENIDTSSGYTVGWLTTTDPDAGDTTAYTINGGADNALFTIGGAGNDELILTDGILDFETQSSYEVTVRITDSGGLTHDQTFTILVNDLNEAPVITSLAAVNAAENQTSVTTVTATDADGDTPTFSITGGADSTLFSITAGGVLTFNSGQDFETFADADNNGLYEVEVTANDGNTGTDVQTILVTVTDVNEAPTLVTLSSSTVDENIDTSSGYTVGWLTTTDPDAGDTTAYTINGGADNALFTIGGAGNDELILTDGILDFETQSSYEVTVRITDSGGLTHDQTFTILVNDLNEAPVITSLAAVNAAENQTSVTTVTATDADGDTPTFSITGGADSTLFSITAGGVLTFNSGQDFETFADADNNGLYEVEVTANDGNTGTDVQTILVTVTDVNEAPTLVTLSSSTVDENIDTSSGYTVGWLTTTDPDAGDTTAYTINGGADNALFTIGGAGNDELILTDGILDFETQSSYEVTVRITDSGGLTHDQTFTILVNDLNNPPTIAGDNTGALTKNIDPDGDGMLEVGGTLTISDPDIAESNFQAGTVVGAYGSLTIDAAGNWNYAADNTQAVIQQLNTGESISDVLTVTTADGTTQNVIVTINGATAIVDQGGDDPGPGPDDDPIEPDPEPEPELPPDEILPAEDELPPREELATSNLPSSKPPVVTPLQWADPKYFVPTISLLTTDNMFSTDNDSPSAVAGIVKYLQRELASQTIARLVPTVSALFSAEAMTQTLDQIQQQLGQTLEMDGKRGQLIIGAATGLGASVFAGYVIWAFRGSSLLLGALTAMPMWRCFDPLPVLMGDDKKRRECDETKSTQHDSDKDETKVKELLGEERAGREVKG